jgi:XTP/dITP diphosphohydrolase
LTALLLATTNAHKLREIRSLLADLRSELLTLNTVPRVPEPNETGATFEENARLKALHYARYTPLPAVAEDSGLVIDALDGEPGVRSARFLRADAPYNERFEEIFRRLAQRPERPRTARFICALCLARGPDVLFETRGVIDGEIASRPQGTAGFGYDPIFYYPPYDCTLAEVTEADKLRVAHRGTAFRAFADWWRLTML